MIKQFFAGMAITVLTRVLTQQELMMTGFISKPRPSAPKRAKLNGKEPFTAIPLR